MAADSKARFLQEAEKYVLHGKVQQAIGEYLKIVKLDPNDVLILNTIGDLYLRQGNSSEANKYFSQVAENYVQNNFFLKAIAVYKKILKVDPDNLAINSTMASLYARQGLSIDARNQYIRVAALLENEGKSKELMEAYENIVELDPSNSTVQRKLAELYLTDGARQKAHAHWTGAARAQAKAGDFPGAADSFSRAMQLDPLDVEAMRGYWDSCLKLNDPAPALNQLKRSVETAPDNLDLREMLGEAHLANKDPETAAKTFQIVISMDESRYASFFAVAQAFLDRKEYDRAIGCLDGIIPVLISRRETSRAVKVYEKVLQSAPEHLAAMVKLASLYSATGDHVRYLETMDKIADHYMAQKKPVEALDYLEKILRINPESEKHRSLHYQAFAEIYPDTPYVAPSAPPEPVPVSPSFERREPAVPEKGSVSNEIVEIDLLINYGLREKALGLLLSLESRDPYDKEVRLRLLSLYRGENKQTEAAEQCLLLAALCRRVKNEDTAQSYLSEATQLVPEMAEYAKNLEAFARKNGIEPLPPAGKAAAAAANRGGSEVDLSSDLLDIFYQGEQEEPAPAEDREPLETDDVMAEPFPQGLPSHGAAKPIEEQLQEVDFYIRLGFHDEALGKLNEIAKANPDSPELASRYEKLGEMKPASVQEPAVAQSREEPVFGEAIPPAPPDNLSIFDELNLDDALDGVDEAQEQIGERAIPAYQRYSAVPKGAKPAAGPNHHRNAAPEEPVNFHTNEMFADLMDEVSALSDQDVSKEPFEDHFSLGIAYRDMELNEEAIREFQLALKIADLKKDARRIVQCCGMLSTCCLKKNMTSSALRWCQTGLSVADISSHEAMALRYDMGVAHSMSGSNERALECFDQVFGLDPGYRDVAQKIDELKGDFERHAP